jgi:hypothetical protein
MTILVAPLFPDPASIILSYCLLRRKTTAASSSNSSSMGIAPDAIATLVDAGAIERAVGLAGAQRAVARLCGVPGAEVRDRNVCV